MYSISNTPLAGARLNRLPFRSPYPQKLYHKLSINTTLIFTLKRNSHFVGIRFHKSAYSRNGFFACKLAEFYKVHTLVLVKIV